EAEATGVGVEQTSKRRGTQVTTLTPTPLASASRRRATLPTRGRVKRSQILAIDDEPRVRRHVVIEPPRGRVGFLGVPRTPADLRLLVARLDEHASHAFAAGRLGREQVLEITGRPEHRGVAVKEIMHEPDEAAVALGHQRMHGLIRVEKAAPGRLRHLGRQRRRAETAVEFVVAVPERQPPGKVGALDAANGGCGHLTSVPVGRGGTHKRSVVSASTCTPSMKSAIAMASAGLWLPFSLRTSRTDAGTPRRAKVAAS